MPPDADSPHEPRQRPLWQGAIEFAIWALIFTAAAAFNVAVTAMDFESAGHALALWEPVTWEFSSAGVSLLLLPAVLAFCERWPLHADTWPRRLPAYLLASVAWSVIHVAGMVFVRELAYAAAGQDYDPGGWTRRFGYEYLKDIRTFAMIVLAAHVYRWFWRRLQGEARLLDTPDDMPAAPAVDRPERFLVRKLGREFLVAANDIEWLQASGNYVNLRVRGHDYPLRSTIAGIEARLDPGRFARIHRSYIVNLDHVASIEPLDTGDARVHLRDGNVVPCSRRHRETLRGVAGAGA